MLAGREAELARIDRLLDDARAARSGVLVVVGEPGIGKTSLLEHAVVRADDMLALRAQGVETESELPFAALHELLGPIVDSIDEIPEPQAAALRGALLLETTDEVDPFAVYAAVLSTVAVASDRRPTVLVVDDAHWLDTASTEALAFAGRRLKSDCVAMLVALRPEAASPFLRAPFAQLLLAALDRSAAAQLMRDARGRAPGGRVVEQLVEATGGNPLALIELATELSDGEFDGRVPLRRVPPTRIVEEAFAARLGPLPHTARTALLVAAASESDDMHELLSAAVTLGSDAGGFEVAEEARIVRIDEGTVHFAHPLLRAAVIAAASPAELRDAHRALANAVAGSRGPERRAWHLAAAALAPDEEIASALESAADSYRLRSGYLASARAVERAARLSPEDEKRAGRLVAAARSARRAGRAPWASEMLAEAVVLTTDPAVRTEIEFQRAAIEAWQGSLESAQGRYVRVADQIEGAEPARAAAALAYAAALSVVGGDTAGALATTRRAAALVERAAVDEKTEAQVLETLGCVLLLRGESDEGLALIRRVASWFEERGDPADSEYVAGCLIWIEEYARARQLLEALVDAARRGGDLRTLAEALEILSDLEFRTGRWSAALAAAAESTRLAEDTDQTVQLAYSLAALAVIEAAHGDEVCVGHAERARALATEYGLAVLTEFIGFALGLFELGTGSPERAAAHLDEVARYTERTGRGEPAVLPWAGDRIEALLLSNRVNEAEEGLATLERQAAATGRVWAHAAAARCRGLLAEDSEFAEHFEDALRWEARAPVPFERARIELGFGQRLRRARRRSESRAHLRSALRLFESLGARPWVERTRRELQASGETMRPRDAAAADVLTSHELQVALLVASGASNREAAARLFLSPKTIESHLSSVYRKLGVRSRVALAQRMRDNGDTRFGAARS